MQRLGDAGAQEARRAHNDIVPAALSANYGSEIKHPKCHASNAPASRIISVKS